MQCARVEREGAFSNKLYERVLISVVCSAAFNAELLGATCVVKSSENH